MIHVAVVGAGFGGYTLAPAFQRAGARVVAICAPSSERRERVAAALGIPDTYASLAEVLDRRRVDAVAVAVPPDRQPPIATLAIERGLAVFAEKPLAASLEDAERLAAMARRCGAITAVDFLFPEIPAWRTARRLLGEGAIGELRHIVVDWRFQSYDHRHGLKGWKTDAARGGGVLQHFGSHVLHYLSYFGGEVARVTGSLSGPDGEDTLATLHLGFSSGASAAALICNAASGLRPTHAVTLYGSTGVMQLTGASDNPVRFALTVEDSKGVASAVTADEPEVVLPPGTDPRVGPAERLARRFLGAIVERSAMTPSFDDGAKVQRWMAGVSGAGV